MYQSVQNIFTVKKDRPDYKKTYFENMLNKNKTSTNSLYKIMLKFGYHYVCENGHYFVYSSYEWKVKQRFEKTIKPLLQELLGDK